MVFFHYSDPYLNFGASQSPGSAASPNCHFGSVYTNSGSEDSDSDNCSPDKMDPNSLMGDEDYDHIAKIFYNHPTIQAVMADNWKI